MQNPASSHSKWIEGIEQEIAFWQHWFLTQGNQWPDEYRNRLDPRLPLQERLLDLASRGKKPGDTLRILDAGAGPLTMVGKVAPGYQLELRAVDALAKLYDRVLQEFKIEPPIRTESCEVEQLSRAFEADSFDLVHIRNALDHCHDPVLGLFNMLGVLSPGGHLVITGWVNEGSSENFAGLHQWDFDVADGEFLISDRSGRRIQVSRTLAPIATPVAMEPGFKQEKMMTAIFQKRTGLDLVGFNLTKLLMIGT